MIFSLFLMCHTICPAIGGPVIIPGPLPLPGGVLAQDNATMEAFGIIKDEILAMAEETRKKKR